MDDLGPRTIGSDDPIAHAWSDPVDPAAPLARA